MQIFQVDAFTSTLFSGNPAAVVPLESWLPDATLQAIAAENNLSETAYLVPAGSAAWELRWFTPAAEVPLCGHATLASAHVLFEILGAQAPALTFHTRWSGDLVVERDGARLAMRLPRRRTMPVDQADVAAGVLGLRPRETFVVPVQDDETLLAVFASEAEVRDLTPDLAAMRRIDARGVLVTAPGTQADFVSRYFAPKYGIDEDPVTGSAHCALVPFWAERLNKTDFIARQLSKRGGELHCRLEEDRVVVAGRAVLYLSGEIHLPS
ncbi:PhzF family phenazine biosynthesis protein [Mangrovibrevibacter kandeliae]|uniref:PhzF family phenazine biosynthesis protein n=1 Tax=Mangrovibrevibacter kandeliae TaxID=2968473 RepID=UPI002118D01F|nr:PhzF family phenazine biosynthesis protein [Aurantimonas sp. CSK15Z-1]MCQ8783980.1 PhzF family phenazine biosynthesis protein [Aurantimonas sp. CSK15Z-1]